MTTAYRDNAIHFACLHDLEEERALRRDVEEELRDTLEEVAKERNEERKIRRVVWIMSISGILIACGMRLHLLVCESLTSLSPAPLATPTIDFCHDEAFMVSRQVPPIADHHMRCASPQATLAPILIDEDVLWQCSCPHKP